MALSLALVSLQYSTILSKAVMPNAIASAKIGDDAASAVEQRVLGWCRSHKGRPSPRSARRRSSSLRASRRRTTTRRRSSRHGGTTTAHSRAARGSSRPARLYPHPRLAHVYHERFLFLEVCYARQLQRRQARQTHSRRDREPRRSLRQLRHHGDEFNSEYKKLVSSIYALDEFEQLKWLPG